jgi:hypothetical protein
VSHEAVQALKDLLAPTQLIDAVRGTRHRVNRSSVTPAERFVLYLLADESRDGEISDTCLQDVAALTGWSYRHIQTIITALADEDRQGGRLLAPTGKGGHKGQCVELRLAFVAEIARSPVRAIEPDEPHSTNKARSPVRAPRNPQEHPSSSSDESQAPSSATSATRDRARESGREIARRDDDSMSELADFLGVARLDPELSTTDRRVMQAWRAADDYAEHVAQQQERARLDQRPREIE